jgi:hypothetical protein
MIEISHWSAPLFTEHLNAATGYNAKTQYDFSRSGKGPVSGLAPKTFSST